MDTWFGSPTHIITAVAVCVVALLLDRWMLHAGVIEHNHRRVTHRKLRALAARRKPAAGTLAPCNAPVAGAKHSKRATPLARPAPESPDVTLGAGSPTPAVAGTTATRGSADRTPIVESRPAPASPLGGAGSSLQAGDSCLDRDPAVTTTSDGSQPAPASPQPAGAGPEPRSAAVSPPTGGGPGPKPPVDVVPPDAAPTGTASAISSPDAVALATKGAA